MFEADYYDEETQGDFKWGVAPARSTRTKEWSHPEDYLITVLEGRYGAS